MKKQWFLSSIEDEIEGLINVLNNMLNPWSVALSYNLTGFSSSQEII